MLTKILTQRIEPILNFNVFSLRLHLFSVIWLSHFFSTVFFTAVSQAGALDWFTKYITNDKAQQKLELQIAKVAGEDIRPEAKEMKRLITKSCFMCHVRVEGESDGNGDIILKRFGDFTKAGVLRKYVANGSAGNAEQTNLYSRVESNNMPQFGTLAPKDKSELLLAIKNWVDAGAPDLESVKSLPAVSKEEALIRVEKDLLAQREPRFIRYISLLNIFNNNETQADMPATLAAVSKFLNSTSWNPNIVRPLSLDPKTNVILRIDIRNYSWSTEQWQVIEQSYPYANDYTDIRAEGRDIMRNLREATGSAVPLVRADWMVATLSLPPFYDRLLKLPNTDTQLETLLGINVSNNIVSGDVVRAGFISPGISKNNRMIERHKTQFGSYWKSYDFASAGNDPSKNLTKSPLGPASLSAQGFVQDGGEIIFNLPNGLQAYMLVDRKGRKIDFAPSNIVKGGFPVHKPPGINWIEPSGKLILTKNVEEHAIVNGASCIICHDQGMKIRPDEIGAFFKSSANTKEGNFSSAQLASVTKLYDRERYDKIVREDRSIFMASLAKAGTQEGEPIGIVIQNYIRDLDQKKLISELRLLGSDLESIQRIPKLRGLRQFLNESKLGIKRSEFEIQYQIIFRDILTELRNLPALESKPIRPPSNEIFQGAAPTSPSPKAPAEAPAVIKAAPPAPISQPQVIKENKKPGQAEVLTLCQRVEAPALQQACEKMAAESHFQGIALNRCTQMVSARFLVKCLATIRDRTYDSAVLSGCNLPNRDELPVELRSSKFLDVQLPAALTKQLDYALSCM